MNISNDNLTSQSDLDVWSLPPTHNAPSSDKVQETTSNEPTRTHAAIPRSFSSRVRVSRRELYNLTAQLAIMTQSGVDVSSALISMARQCKNRNLKTVLETIHGELIDGRQLSDSLRLFPNIFNETYVASIGAGEASGNMTRVLSQLAQLQRNEIRLRSSIRKVLIYPVILTLVSASVLSGLVLFVLPQFAGVFEQFDTPLPYITQLLIDTSVFVRGNIVICGLIGFAAIAAVLSLRITNTGRRLVDRFLLEAPIVRDVTRSLYFGRICRLMGLMLSSGLPLLETLGLAKRSISNHLYQQLFSELEEDVLNGGGLTQRILSSELIPTSAAEMVATGEKTGTLETVTELVGAHYEEDGETKLRDMVTLLEPAITLIMGSLVCVVVMAVLLPMFDIATFANK